MIREYYKKSQIEKNKKKHSEERIGRFDCVLNYIILGFRYRLKFIISWIFWLIHSSTCPSVIPIPIILYWFVHLKVVFLRSKNLLVELCDTKLDLVQLVCEEQRENWVRSLFECKTRVAKKFKWHSLSEICEGVSIYYFYCANIVLQWICQMVKKVNNQNLILKKITQQALLNEMRNCAKVSEIKRTMFSNQLIIIVYKKEFLSTNDLNPTFPSSIMFLL